jgi:hypothetical protein
MDALKNSIERSSRTEQVPLVKTQIADGYFCGDCGLGGGASGFFWSGF